MGKYSPFDNATLIFQVYGSYTVDSTTGNTVQNNVSETYKCNVQLDGAFTENKEGVNEVSASCTGKLLEPAVFTSKIKVGMEAAATINGATGKLRILDLGTNVLPFARATQFQSFTGVFEQNGAAG